MTSASNRIARFLSFRGVRRLANDEESRPISVKECLRARGSVRSQGRDSSFAYGELRMTTILSGRSGFTLIELMVSVALGLIIMLVAVTAFTQGAGVTTLSHAKTEAMHNAQIALDFLEKDLEAATLNAEGSLFVGTHDSIPADGFTGETLEFLTVSGQAGITGNAHVRYYATTRAGEAGSRLIRFPCACSAATPSGPCGEALPIPAFTTVNLPAFPPNATDERTYMVAYGVRDMTIRYYYEGTWHDAWNSADAGDPVSFRLLPQVVEISLTLVDSDGKLNNPDNPVRVRRLVTLPDKK